MGEVALLLASVSVLLMLDQALDHARASHRTRAPHARSFVSHARKVAPSRLMAHPQEEVRS
jgi:hypothetical protein